MILIDIRKEYGQEVADLVAEYSHHRWKVEEVTTESRQFSEKDAGNLSQNVKKLMLASILVSLKTLDADQKLSAEKIKRSRYSVRDYRGANQKIEAEVGKILMKYKSTWRKVLLQAWNALLLTAIFLFIITTCTNFDNTRRSRYVYYVFVEEVESELSLDIIDIKKLTDLKNVTLSNCVYVPLKIPIVGLIALYKIKILCNLVLEDFSSCFCLAGIIDRLAGIIEK